MRRFRRITPLTMKLNPADIECVLRPFRPAAVYLFGSTVTGRQHPESDIDIAFLPDRPCDPYEVFQAAQQLAAQLGCEVDLVDLSQASAVMKAQVLETGTRLIVADERRVDEFEMYALSDYARANEERREVLAAFGISPTPTTNPVVKVA